MIGKSTSGKGFSGLLDYLTEPEKFEWMEVRNLPPLNQEIIAKDMQLLSMKSRVIKPVYHVSLSWHKDDKPTSKQMEEVADKFLDEMGLKDHQVVIISHKDQKHPHIHLMINRVHPKTHIAWEKYLYKGEGRNRKVVMGDYERREKFLRKIEKEYGWLKVQGKHSDKNLEKEFDGKSPEPWEIHKEWKKREVAAGIGFESEIVDMRTPKLKAMDIKEELFNAKSFVEFDNILAKKDLWMEKKGQGIVITDGEDGVPASHISRAFSKNKLEERFSQSSADYFEKREVLVSKAAGDQMLIKALALHTISELKNSSDLTKSGVKRINEEIERIYKSKEHQTLREDIKEELSKVYLHAGRSYNSFIASIQKYGYEETFKQLVESPDKFGEIRKGANAIYLSEKFREFEKFNQMSTVYLDTVIKDEELLRNKKQELQDNSVSLQKQVVDVKQQANRALHTIIAKTEEGKDLLRIKKQYDQAIQLVHHLISFHRSLRLLSKGIGEQYSRNLIKEIGLPPSKLAMNSFAACSKQLLRNDNKQRNNQLSR